MLGSHGLSERGANCALVLVLLQLHIEEPPADLWLLSGLVPPAPGSEAEKQWKQTNAAQPYDTTANEDIADYFHRMYSRFNERGAPASATEPEHKA